MAGQKLSTYPDDKLTNDAITLSCHKTLQRLYLLVIKESYFLYESLLLESFKQ